MKKRMKRCFAVLMVFVLVASLHLETASAASTQTVKMAGKAYYGYAFEVLNLVNQERQKEGLKSLAMDVEMLEAAMDRAAETNVYFSHTRPDGSDCFEIFPQGLWAYGENIAAGQPSPESVMDSWMNSPGHRSNILGSNFNVIGVGCYQAGDVLYWVQTFGKKDSVEEASKSGYKDGKRKAAVKADASITNAIMVSASSQTLAQGGKGKLKVTMANPEMPYGSIPFYNTQFTFESSNKNIVSVDSKGNLKGLKKGSATIKVIFKNSGKSAGNAVKITVR